MKRTALTLEAKAQIAADVAANGEMWAIWMKIDRDFATPERPALREVWPFFMSAGVYGKGRLVEMGLWADWMGK